MKRKIAAAALAVSMSLGALAPALADGKASTRNLLIIGAAAALFTHNYINKTREHRTEVLRVQRRQAAYRDWYYKKYGYYPTDADFARWYKQTYGVSPQTS